MAKTRVSPHEFIRNIIEGDNVGLAKRKLTSMGEAAVRPLLDAMTGDHGPINDALPELVNVLERIAKKDVKHVIAVMKGDHPALNIVVWAVGHGSVRKGRMHPTAKRVLQKHLKHKDAAIRHVAETHLGRVKKAKKSARKRPKATAKSKPPQSKTKPQRKTKTAVTAKTKRPITKRATKKSSAKKR